MASAIVAAGYESDIRQLPQGGQLPDERPSAPASPDGTLRSMTRNGERGEYRHWVGVLNQGPLTSATNVFRLEHMLAARPSTATPQTPHPKVGDVAPDFEVDRTDGRSIRLSEFRGKPVIMRLTRAVTGAII